MSWRNFPPNQFGGKLCPYWYDVNIKNSAKAPPLVDWFLENILGVLLLLRSYWNSLCHSKLQYSLAVLILILFKNCICDLLSILHIVGIYTH